MPKTLATTVDRLLHHATCASLEATRCGSAGHLGKGGAPDLTSGANLVVATGELSWPSPGGFPIFSPGDPNGP
jgi:hypothetical protein